MVDHPEKFTTFVGTLDYQVTDSDDPDDTPEAVPVSGEVWFTPLIAEGDLIALPHYPGGARSRVPATIKAKLVDGVLQDDQSHDFVKLWAADEWTNPQVVNYEVSFHKSEAEGRQIRDPSSFTFEAVPDATLSLTAVQRVPNTGVPGQTRGEQGVSIANIVETAGALVITYDDTSVNTVPLPGFATSIATAQAARDLALSYRNSAQTYRNEAETFKNQAGTSASNAATSEFNADASADAAAASAVTAAGWAGAPADNSVSTVKIQDNAVTTPKILDAAVTLAKTSSGVQTSLGKADSSVQTSGAQTVGGIKTFSAEPVVPTATLATSPVTKAQHDLKAPLAAPALTGAATLDGQALVKTNDSRLTDTRTPTAGTVPCDFVWVAQAGVRVTGVGDLAAGMYVGRAFTISKAIYQFDTADASGSTAVEIRRNGSQIAASVLTVSAANQADGTGTDAARTATFTQSFSVGDRFALNAPSIGTTPGKGLRVYIFGTWN